MARAEKQGHIPFFVKHFTKKGMCPCFKGCSEGGSNHPSFEFGDALPHPSILNVTIHYKIKKSILGYIKLANIS
jgi:hypothetical protein